MGRKSNISKDISKLGIKLDNQKKIKVNKKQIGSDRLANAIGSMNNKDNFIILDFGTATTFDVIDKSGDYIGGLIAPGINLSLDSLYRKTSKLPLIKLKKTETAVMPLPDHFFTQYYILSNWCIIQCFIIM